MSVQNQHFPFDLGDPFNVETAWFEGGTISLCDDEMHQLGQALVECLASREDVEKGRWCIQVKSLGVIDKWQESNFEEFTSPYGKDDVCVTYDGRFEWVLPWEEAISSCEHYAESHAEDMDDDARSRITLLSQRATKATCLMKDECFGPVMGQCAFEFMEAFSKGDFEADPHQTVWEVLHQDRFFLDDVLVSISVFVGDWLNDDALKESGWFEYFEHLVHEMTFEECEQRARRVRSRDRCGELIAAVTQHAHPTRQDERPEWAIVYGPK